MTNYNPRDVFSVTLRHIRIWVHWDKRRLQFEHLTSDREPELVFTVTEPKSRLEVTGGKQMLMRADQKVRMQVRAVDAKGNSAVLETIVWETTDANVVSLEQDPNDPTVCWAWGGAVGNASVNVRADADLDIGETRELSGSLDFTIVSGEAMVLTVEAGTPEPQ